MAEDVSAVSSTDHNNWLNAVQELSTTVTASGGLLALAQALSPVSRHRLLMRSRFDSALDFRVMGFYLPGEGFAEFGSGIGDGFDPGLVALDPDVSGDGAMARQQAEGDDQIQGSLCR